MATISAEVYAWPECALYVYPTGGPSAIMAYAEDVHLNVTWTWNKFKNQNTGGFAARTNFVLADKDVTLQIGQMFYDRTTFLQANSATAFNANLVFSGSGGLSQSAEFQLWSGVFTQFSLGGQHADIFRASPVSLRFADASALY